MVSKQARNKPIGLFTYHFNATWQVNDILFRLHRLFVFVGNKVLVDNLKKSPVVMAVYFLICSFLLFQLIITSSSRAQSSVNNSAATDVIDEEWWRTSPRICKKSCVVQVWNPCSERWIGYYTLYFLSGTQSNVDIVLL